MVVMLRQRPRELVLPELDREGKAQQRMMPEKGQWQYWGQAGKAWDPTDHSIGHRIKWKENSRDHTPIVCPHNHSLPHK